MKAYKQQLGIALMEVLVALLILAISILGFVALQYRALEAMGEGENRIQAINIARDLAEKMRVNRSELLVYAQTLARPVSILPRPNCFHSLCTPTQKAVFDASLIKLSAQRVGMSINMFDCPKVNNGRQCAYIAWNDTAATLGDSPEDCTNNTGSYQPTSTCLVMEVY